MFRSLLKSSCIIVLLSYSASTGHAQDYESYWAYEQTIKYKLFIPENYSSDQLYPLILEFDDHRDLRIWTDSLAQIENPCFVLTIPRGITAGSFSEYFDVVAHLINKLQQQYSIDQYRIYAIGESAGGIVTWGLVSWFRPFNFAAIIPCASYGWPEGVPLLEHIPAAWIFHGGADPVFLPQRSREMVCAIQEVDTDFVFTHSDPIDCDNINQILYKNSSDMMIDSLIESGQRFFYTEYEGVGHVIYDIVYKEELLPKWLFKHKLSKLPYRFKESAKTEIIPFLNEIKDSPALTKGTTGEWDQGGVYKPEVIDEGDTLKMWYSGKRSDWYEGEFSIGYAWSEDGVSWHKYESNPVLTAQLDWENGVILGTAVIKDGDLYKMWYGADLKEWYPGTVGYATSPDGKNWTRNAEPVLLTGGPDDWDYNIIAPYTVIKEGDTYKMWYYAGSPYRVFYIGYATSTDGINWTKYDDPSTSEDPFAHSDPVLKPGPLGVEWDFNAVLEPAVIKAGNNYEMYYVGESFSCSFINYARSYDGINWLKSISNPVLHRRTDSGFRIDQYYGGSAVLRDDIVHLWYSSRTTEGEFEIGYAQDWKEIVFAESFQTDKSFTEPDTDIKLLAEIKNSPAHNIGISCIIESEDKSLKDSVLLYDDGIHGDVSASDGIWSNLWNIGSEERNFSSRVKIQDHDAGTVRISDSPIHFTSIGSIDLQEIIYGAWTGGRVIKPVLPIKLSLTNLGSTVTAKDISVFLKINDPRVTSIAGNQQVFGDIGSDETIWCSDSFSVVFNPDSLTPMIKLDIQLDIYSAGIHYWTDSTQLVTRIEDQNIEFAADIPIKFNLYQNYPNPFNPVTKIRFDLPEKDIINISVYNNLGQEVAVLIKNQFFNPGSYEVELNGNNLASGVYFYSLKSEKYYAVGKMLLLR